MRMEYNQESHSKPNFRLGSGPINVGPLPMASILNISCTNNFWAFITHIHIGVKNPNPEKKTGTGFLQSKHVSNRVCISSPKLVLGTGDDLYPVITENRNRVFQKYPIYNRKIPKKVCQYPIIVSITFCVLLISFRDFTNSLELG